MKGFEDEMVSSALSRSETVLTHRKGDAPGASATGSAVYHCH